MKTETVVEAVKAAPPLSVGGLTFMGIYLNEWIMLGTGLYTLFLLIDKLPTVIERIRQFWSWVQRKRGKHG